MTHDYIEVAVSKQLKEGRAMAVHVGENKIALFRWQGNVFALKDFCPHQGAPLSDGLVEDGCAVCFYHEWKFRLEDGAFTHNELIKIPRYKTNETGGKIYVSTQEINS